MTQSGEVVSHRAHNPGTGGANPSSATKHGVFMIAIDTYIRPMLGFEDECLAHWTEFLSNNSNENLYNFFNDCINQNLIINLFLWVPHELPLTLNIGLLRYYSQDLSTATLVKEKFEDPTASFSLKKFCNQMKFDFVCSDPKEIAFDEDPSDGFLPVIGPAENCVWDLNFPMFNDLIGYEPNDHARLILLQNLSSQKSKYFPE